MHPKNPLFQKCITYLESLPNIKATIQGEPYFSSEVLADGKLIINISNQSVSYVCEIKTNITNDVIEPVAEYFTHLGQRLNHQERPLLVTRNLSNSIVDRLLERNIEFIDIEGNIYLNSTKIYLLVRNQTSKESTNTSLEITAASLQVMYALLVQPDIMEADFEEIIAATSGASGVTSKTVKTALRKLQELEYIRYKPRRKYEIVDYVKLLERWELGYVERLRAKLLIGTFSPIGKENFSEIADEIEEYADKYNYLIGGELAAAIITGYIRPISATLHLDRNSTVDDRQIAVKLKLKPDPNGNITLFQIFGYNGSIRNELRNFNKYLVHPLLIHAELVRDGSSRLKETAQIIYDRYIEELFT